MITLTLKASFNDAIDFVDKRLDLALVSSDLCQVRDPATGRHGLQTCKAVSDTIYYLINEPGEADLIVFGTEREGSKVKLEKWGLAIRGDSNETRLYIDTYDLAVEKQIIKPKSARTAKASEQLDETIKRFRLPKAIRKIVPFLIAIPLIVLLTPVILFLFSAAGVIFGTYIACYPFIYLYKKRRFDAKQRMLVRFAGVFEEKFQIIKRTESKDWVGFFGRVKSAVKDTIKDEFRLPPRR
jgi:hypothetical protein